MEFVGMAFKRAIWLLKCANWVDITKYIKKVTTQLKNIHRSAGSSEDTVGTYETVVNVICSYEAHECRTIFEALKNALKRLKKASKD